MNRYEHDATGSDGAVPLRGRRRVVLGAVIVLAATLVLLGLALAVVSALRAGGDAQAASFHRFLGPTISSALIAAT